MLTLFEDEAYINECFKNYLTETKVLDWKYENAVKQILDLGFQPNEVEMDLKKLGAMYKSLVNDMKDEHSATYSEDENQKVTNIIEHMEFLCTAAPIKKLLKEKKWQRRRAKEREKKTAEKKFDKLPTSEKFAHLAKYYGDDGVLDLQKANIPKRFYKHMRKMKEELDTLLQPLVTLEEREIRETDEHNPVKIAINVKGNNRVQIHSMSIMNNMKGMPDPWIESATSRLADERLTSYDTPPRASK
ncbi:hypothetical protein G6F61_010619 [Rhizopus arrhizus]|nr:hypothetical protein G6F61_010619 [Rhizopus arrhizus]